MKIALTNLSDKKFKNSRLILNESAKRFGITKVFSYDFEEIKKTSFFLDNIEIFESIKGLGYWLWKPYIILKTIEQMDEGDVVIYSDCGIEIIEALDPLIKVCLDKEDVLLFGNANDLNSSWTKRDCFVLMDCDCDKYWNSLHCDAAFCLFKKSEQSIGFINEWLSYGTNKHIITDVPNVNGLPNFPNFIEHRWDQSILSLLAHKYQLTLYRMPTQFGNHYKSKEFRLQGEMNCVNQSYQSQVSYYFIIPYYNSLYGQLLNHHRSKEDPQSDPEIVVKANQKQEISFTRLIKGLVNNLSFKKKIKSF